jgi:hypothetical protein
VGRSHWLICNELRFEGEDIPFPAIRGRIHDAFGLDFKVCAKRVGEIVQEGLATASDADVKKYGARTVISPTPRLITVFDSHVFACTNALLGLGAELGMTMSQREMIGTEQQPIEPFRQFWETVGELWQDETHAFLKRSLGKSPAQLLDARRDLMTYPYWYIFLTSWIHGHPESLPAQPYLLVDDFHGELYKRLGIGSRATRDYVNKMLLWGFLERLNRTHGVQKGKFAVRMAPAAFDHFSAAFGDLRAPVEEFVAEVTAVPASPDGLQSGKVLPFHSLGKNESATSQQDDPANSRHPGDDDAQTN